MCVGVKGSEAVRPNTRSSPRRPVRARCSSSTSRNVPATGTRRVPAALFGATSPSTSSHERETLISVRVSGLNPFVQAAIEQMTGRSLLSGAPIKHNALSNFAQSIPQVALVQALRGKQAAT
jgi:hypothetical protein